MEQQFTHSINFSVYDKFGNELLSETLEKSSTSKSFSHSFKSLLGVIASRIANTPKILNEKKSRIVHLTLSMENILLPIEVELPPNDSNCKSRRISSNIIIELIKKLSLGISDSKIFEIPLISPLVDLYNFNKTVTAVKMQQWNWNLEDVILFIKSNTIILISLETIDIDRCLLKNNQEWGQSLILKIESLSQEKRKAEKVLDDLLKRKSGTKLFGNDILGNPAPIETVFRPEISVPMGGQPR